MKLRHTLLSFLLATGLTAFAANETQTTDQVSSSISLTTDVDYIITATEPFATAGSVDIVNTDHAVLIFTSVKPSKVISTWLSHVYINSEQAVNGENCQVKMYDRGAIILPYGKDCAPLTCYTEPNFEGESCNTYTEGHSGGFMKTLTTDQLNNQISSFKLKRGYMVTFAIGTAGWGYSRCFIADKEDLEIKTLPAILNNKISSYRILKWFNARKAGIGDSNDRNAIDKMNLSWCYRMWPDPQGLDYLPDCEYIPHHYKENYPTYGELGTKEFSCHIKGNNEPGNPKDEAPCSVDDVLAVWQEAMRTGMRLGSESSHDGSLKHLDAFIDSIDARGWRCDFLDIHCYWDTGFRESNLKDFSDNHGHGRPIWISEWIWGASWNHNGAFADGVTDARILERTKEILDNLNTNDRVERYAYWNSESKAKIYLNGSVTELGKAYGETNDGIGFNAAVQFIPKETRLTAPSNFAATYDRKTGQVVLTWDDANGELSETINVQCKKPGSISYTTIATVTPKDKTSNSGASYKYTDEVDEPGTYTYRIQVVAYNNAKFTTSDAIINAAPAQGTETFQHGRLTMADTEAAKTYFSESFETAPLVFLGSITNSNTTFYSGNNLSATNRDNFTFQFVPWLTSKATTLAKPEELPFLALMEGHYKYGNLDCEVKKVQSNAANSNLWTDETIVTFDTPFPEGVTPVVMTELLKPSYATASTKATSLTVRVYDVTNTGFKFIVYPEDASERKVILKQNLCYIAITPGFANIDEESGIMIAAGHGQDNPIYGSIANENSLKVEQYNKASGQNETETLRLKTPTILTSLQTNNYPSASMLRRTNITEKDEQNNTWTTGVKIKRICDHNITVDGTEIPSTSGLDKYAAYRDNLGWIAIAPYAEGGSRPADIDTSIDSPQSAQQLNVRIIEGRIYVEGHNTFKVTTASGMELPSDKPLPTGIYFISAGGNTTKIFVK